MSQTLVTRLTSLATQMKSSQTQTDMSCDAVTQTEAIHSYESKGTNIDLNDCLIAIEKQTDTKDMDKNCVPSLVVKKLSNESDEKTDEMKDLKVELKSKYTTDEQSNCFTLAIYDDQSTQTEDNFIEYLKRKLNLFCDCETQTDSYKMPTDISSQINSDFIASSKEDSEMSNLDNTVGEISAKHLSVGTQATWGGLYMFPHIRYPVSPRKFKTQHSFRSRSLPQDLDSHYVLDVSCQTEQLFCATFRPIHLSGSILPPLYHPMATLLMPLGKLLLNN